ncbi:MAG: hypothetical protein H7267_00830, partial [Sandarakinorhabdus sp.]|nr:hypothetical protein [Sandarakinorhabdus sp.]
AIMRADRALGSARLGVAVALLTEAGTLLGSQFPASFGIGGAATTSVIASVMVPIGDWSVAAEASIGVTRPDLTGAGLVQSGARLVGTAASVAISRAAIFAGDDRISLTIAQPLRASGWAMLATQAEAVRLGPSGREIAVEAGYARNFAGGGFSLGSFWRSQPGNIAGAAADIGGAARLRLRF